MSRRAAARNGADPLNGRGTTGHAVGLMDAAGSITVRDGKEPFGMPARRKRSEAAASGYARKSAVDALLLEHVTSYGGPRTSRPDVHVDRTIVSRSVSAGRVPQVSAC